MSVRKVLAVVKVKGTGTDRLAGDEHRSWRLRNPRWKVTQPRHAVGALSGTGQVRLGGDCRRKDAAFLKNIF